MSSTPFLNFVNPSGRGRQFAGYELTSSLMEEDERELDNSANNHENSSGSGAFNAGFNDIPMHTSTTGDHRRVAFGTTPEREITETEHGSSDEEVPHSLIIETSPAAKRRARQPRTSRTRSSHKTPVLPIAHPVASQRLDQDESDDDVPLLGTTPKAKGRGLDAYQQAMWRWTNVYNLDEYLQEVYAYYQGKGIYSIALSRGLNLLTVGFVIAFTTFLWGCIDYSKIPAEGNGRLSDVIVDKCVSRLSGWTRLFLILFGAFYLWQIVTFCFGITRLMDMYQFYTHLLKIPDADIGTISWPEVVKRIEAIRDENPLTAVGSSAQNDPDYTTPTAKIDAHDIANRIMRRENYLIALFNKDLLDLRLPLPDMGHRFLMLLGLYEKEKRGTTLTKALEWNLRFCLMDYLFDQSGRVKKSFLDGRNRETLIKGLQTRFIFMGCLNAIFVPFIIPYLIIYSFFRYFEEAQKNPSAISSRRYTPYAEWKFREFNELPHQFARRLDTSYPTANMYLNQFPREHLAVIMRFVAFIAGSFAAVLLLASLVDPDLFLHFEITPHRTVLFYIGLFGTILAIARGMIPEAHNVFDPEILMREVIRHTHYMPETWKGNLHSQKVNKEFGLLFTMKIMIFVQEGLSVVLTPLILWFSLPNCAPGIVDFFREFTVHVDGLGYVCSFALFDFKRHGNIKFGAPTEQSDERLQSKDGKMEKSFLAFKAAHPEWNPTDPTGSLYLERLREMHQDLSGQPVPSALSRHSTLAVGQSQYGNTGFSRVLHRSTLNERSEMYERALAQSMANAKSRNMRAAGLQITSTSGSGMATRRQASMSQRAAEVDTVVDPVRMDRDDDGGIESELGDSYVDDVRLRGGRIVLDEDDDARRAARKGRTPDEEELDQVEAEELANGGVLGLLAQIYDRRRPMM